MSPQAPSHSIRAVETRRAALLSVASNSLLTATKLVAGFASGSISVLSEALHSGNDLIAALLAFFSVRKANEPADEEHVYGHGKYEALSGAIEAALIVVAALGILYTALRAVFLGRLQQLDHGPAVGVMGLSMVVNILVSAHLYRVARRHDSMALQADAAHLSADVWCSAAVFAGLAMAWGLEHFGIQAHWIDPLLAVIVALIVMGQGTRIAREAVNQLLDRALPEDEIQRIVATIRGHHSLYVDFHKLRSRRAGHERHIDLHLVVCAEMTVTEAHEITDHLEQEIAALFPRAHVMIHTEPCDETGCPVRRPVGAAHRRDPRCVRGPQAANETEDTGGAAAESGWPGSCHSERQSRTAR